MGGGGKRYASWQGELRGGEGYPALAREEGGRWGGRGTPGLVWNAHSPPPEAWQIENITPRRTTYGGGGGGKYRTLPCSH